MTLLLLACLTKVPQSEGDSGQPVEADADTDTDTDADADADTDSDTDTDVMLECDEPVDFDMTVDYAPVIAAYSAGTFEFGWHSWLYSALYDASGDCPQAVASPDSIRLGGDCETDSMEYAGWVELTEDDAGVLTIAYQGFSMEGTFSSSDGRGTDIEYEAEGVIELTEADGVRRWTSALWESRWFGDERPMDVAQVEGYRELELEMTLGEGGDVLSYAWTGHAELDRSEFEGFIGAYCHRGDIEILDECLDEGVGTYDVQGDGYATIRYDGDTACDDCVLVAVNGGAEEEVCFD